MRHNQHSLTPNLKLQQPREADEAGVGEEEAVVTEEIEVQEELVEVPHKTLTLVQNILVLNIRTCRPETGPGALCTSSGAGRHFSVRNRRHVHGRTSTPPSPARIERSTSSASLTQILNEYTKCCMIKGCQKYKILLIYKMKSKARPLILSGVQVVSK